MMGAVATVLALIFSVALLVLSMVSTLFGPRLLYRFLQDWVTQVTIGLFMGTFVYICLVFLVTHQASHLAFGFVSLTEALDLTTPIGRATAGLPLPHDLL